MGEGSFALPLRGDARSPDVLRAAWLEHAIGLVHRPSTERRSHYFRARLLDQFDGVLHIDETRAVEPLERTAACERGELPETYPHGV